MPPLVKLPTGDATQLTALERRRKISVPAAADLNNLSPDTFLRRYRHLVRKISPRRNVVELGDALDLPPAAQK